MKIAATKVIGYGSAPDWLRDGDCQFVWHAGCHEAMRQQRKSHMLSMDSAFREGYDFHGAICSHCQKPMPS